MHDWAISLSYTLYDCAQLLSYSGSKLKEYWSKKGHTNLRGNPRPKHPRLALDHSPCTWDCWKLFPGAKWKFPATCGRHCFSFSTPTAGLAQLSHLHPSWYLVDLQEAVHLAALVLLLLHLLAEALSSTLLNSVWVLEGPASSAIRFPHIFTTVTAPVEKARRAESPATVPRGVTPKLFCPLQKVVNVLNAN